MPVVLLMLDGLRPDALSQVNAPALEAFMQRGAYTLSARSVMPSITLPCHMSIFHSIPPQRHGILENQWHPMARPVIGLVEQLKMQDRQSAFFYNWEFLRDLSRPGYLEFTYYQDAGFDLDGDAVIAEAAANRLRKGDLDFAFVYFGTIDTVGHGFGWMSDSYLRQIEKVDRWLQALLANFSTDTSVIIQSDHGGHDRIHGTDLPEDMLIPWMAAGPGIKPQYEIQAPLTLLDVAPTIARLLDVKPDPQWEGRVVEEIFLGS